VDRGQDVGVNVFVELRRQFLWVFAQCADGIKLIVEGEIGRVGDQVVELAAGDGGNGGSGPLFKI
jgi:hypothetical protein